MLGGMNNTPKPKRRWFQFSLRTLMLFVTVWAMPCCWVSVRMREASRERETAEAMWKLGARVGRQGRPRWLWSLLGDYCFKSVTSVEFKEGTQVTDATLERLEGLSELLRVHLDGTTITDAGLEHLEGLSQLKMLHLDNTKVTDAGLEHLTGLSQLEVLDLNGTLVTDAGLERLRGMSRLGLLGVSHTKVTQEGVDRLQTALPKCHISSRELEMRRYDALWEKPQY
jgi:hypothetical protein